MVSGGSTPGPVFDRLSVSDLLWSSVTIGLVDERWVDPGSDASNEKLVRARLLQDKAQVAAFLPLMTGASTPAEAAPERNAAYKSYCDDIDVIMLGMGSDGHTASWFPGATGLETALDAENPSCVTAIDATGCPVAGSHTERLTLTARAIGNAALGVLLLFGEDKRAVLESAVDATDIERPVRVAARLLGPKLKTVWAP